MVIRSKYEILERLGGGGMADVYLANHLAFNEVYAIKVVKSALADEPTFQRRFRSEAVLTRKLRHRNAIAVEDYDTTEDGRPYIVMEYVKGRSLRAVVDSEAPLSVPRALGIAIQVARALEAAHKLGITHRDIKPDNILITQGDDSDELVKVLDFGIAKIKEGDDSILEQTATRRGTVVGTPQYMSPEQAVGKVGGDIDGRADIYSLGIVIYEMITGRLPFTSDSAMGYCHHHVNTAPVPPREVATNLEIPPGLSKLVMKSLEKDREQRFANMTEMIAALEDPEHWAGFDPDSAATVIVRSSDPRRIAALEGAVTRIVPAPRGASPKDGLRPPLAQVPHPQQQRFEPIRTSLAAPVAPAAKRLLDQSVTTLPKTNNRTIAFMTVAGVLALSLVSFGLYKYIRLIRGPKQELAQSPTDSAQEASEQAAIPSGKQFVAGAARVDSRDGLTYVWIPPGRFIMGCSTGDSDCHEEEKPAHRVTITKGFWMGQTSVTQSAYRRVTGKNPSEFHGGQLPVDSVNWSEAMAYCSAVGMRLPTEAEWEYAARAGSMTSRYGELDAIAWYADNSGKHRIDGEAIWQDDQSNYGDRLRANGNTTKPDELKLPNAWKLYGMLGNVWQWTADWYDPTYYQHSEPKDPKGPESGQQRVLRGGSWYSGTKYVRVSFRDGFAPDGRYSVNGFRCVSNP
ncbi:MAG: bifunctional serine/threonine-protein kinase/formylglycine-generating enzyme family protein [Terriglobales bacterium]